MQKKAVTLIEILLVVMLSALLMTAIIPFIRSVNDTWNVGSSKTEILQNGRAALETLTRYIRQARRITGIPGTSGNYIKIRDREDKYNIIFYHNVSGSPYYIGASGMINDNDLVMRSDSSGTYEDSLLAASLENLNFNFLKGDGNPATKGNEVKTVQIQMVLSDPQGSTSHTLALEDTVILRQDVKIATTDSGAVWFCHSNEVGELSSDIRISGFSSPNAVSVNSVLLVNGRETVWVADTGGNRIRRIYWTGSNWTFDTITGFSSPRSVSVNPNEPVNGRETCWVADTSGNRIRRISWTGSNWTYDTITGFSGPRSVCVNPNETINGRNTCWVADTGGNRVRKIYWTGTAYSYKSTPSSGWAGSAPRSVSVQATDGTCWVANSGTGANGNRIRQLSCPGICANITTLNNITGFSTPYSVSVNPNETINGRNTCWVADTGGNRVRKIYWTGSNWAYNTFSGFLSPQYVSVNPSTNECWVAVDPVDNVNDRIIRLNSEGDIEFDIGGLTSPLGISVRP